MISPDTRCLFKTVNAPMETAHLAFLARDDKSFGLFHEYLLLKVAVEEGGLDIHLDHFKVVSCNNRQKDP